jgi:transcriptional regulator with XRE-family HTH domain
MGIGNNIKKIRELKNYTQSYMASQLDLSIGGYGKIERDETDIRLSRLNEIAKVLETNLVTILEFNSSNIFLHYNNKNATQNTVVQNQQIQNENGFNDLLANLTEEIKSLKKSIAIIEKRNENI